MAQKSNLTIEVLSIIGGVLTAIFFLGFLVLAMFVITLRGSTPNVINYKIALTNQYAAWEQELTQREKAVKEKEQELGIDMDKTVTAEE